MDPPDRRARGGQTTCTPGAVEAIVVAIVEGIESGDPWDAALRVALRRAHVARSTYYDWRTKAETGEEPYASAVERVESARDALRRTLGKSLLDLADDGSKEDATRLNATKFALERLFPEDWNPARRIEHSGPEGGAIQTETVARVVVLPPLDPELPK